MRAQRGGTEGMAKETGDAAVKKIRAAETILVHTYSVLKEHIWEMQHVLDGKKKTRPKCQVLNK